MHLPEARRGVGGDGRMTSPQVNDPIPADLWPNGCPGISYPSAYTSVAQALNSISAEAPHALVRPRTLDDSRV